MLLMPNAGKYKRPASSREVLQIQMNNKTIIEFGSRRIWGIIKASVCVITQTSALMISHILLDLIQ